MIAQHLGNALIQGKVFVTPFTLDDDKRNPVDKEHNVRTAILAQASYLKFIRDVEHVVVEVFPIDVIQGETLAVAFDSLLEALAQGEQIVRLLVAAHNTQVGNLAQGFDGSVNVFIGKGIAFPFVFDAVDLAKLVFQDGLQQHPRLGVTAGGQGLLRGEIGVSQALEQCQRRFL